MGGYSCICPAWLLPGISLSWWRFAVVGGPCLDCHAGGLCCLCSAAACWSSLCRAARAVTMIINQIKSDCISARLRLPGMGRRSRLDGPGTSII